MTDINIPSPICVYLMRNVCNGCIIRDQNSARFCAIWRSSLSKVLTDIRYDILSTVYPDFLGLKPLAACTWQQSHYKGWQQCTTLIAYRRLTGKYSSHRRRYREISNQKTTTKITQVTTFRRKTNINSKHRIFVSQTSSATQTSDDINVLSAVSKYSAHKISATI